MRSALHILIVLTLLWCGLHSDYPAQAHDGAEQHQLAIDIQIAPEDFGGAHEGSSNIAHNGHHHHCPVAPGPTSASFQCGMGEGKVPLLQRELPGLTSRSQAPPLQPPSA